MVSSGKHLSKLVRLIEQSTECKKLRKNLPLPAYTKNIIMLTNAGKIEKALSETAKMENVLKLLNEQLTPEENEWFSGIIHKLRRDILLAREENELKK